MMREMKSKDTLTSPKKFFSLAEAATKSLTVDSGIGSIDKLTNLAGELKDMDLKNITFTTLPVLDNPAEPEGKKATVVVDQRLADPLLKMIQGDVSLTEAEKKEQAAKDAADAEAKSKADARSRATVAPAGEYGWTSTTAAGPAARLRQLLNWLQNGKGVNKSSNRGQRARQVDDDAAGVRAQPGRPGPGAGRPHGAAGYGTEDGLGGRSGPRPR